VNALIKHAEGKLRIDVGTKLSNASPLSLAAYVSTTEIVAALVGAGANAGQINDVGANTLMDAVSNPACTLEMLELLYSSDNKIGVNQVRIPRTRKWYLISRLVESMHKSRFVSNTDLIMSMAHGRGGTALHFAARGGHVQSISWLLEHGAHQSVHVRNKLGCTPIDVARIFGPFPEIEALLGSVMLDGGFHERYVVRKGTLMQRRDVSSVHESVRDSQTDAGALEDGVADAPAPAAELATAATHKAPPHVNEPPGGSSSGSSAAGDANGNDGDGGVWSSVASTVAHASSHSTADDASQAPPRQDASHGVEFVRLHAKLDSVMEAQTRTLAQTAALSTTLMGDIASLRAEIASLRADLNLSA
jgi:ankyrin repeat protein